MRELSKDDKIYVIEKARTLHNFFSHTLCMNDVTNFYWVLPQLAEVNKYRVLCTAKAAKKSELYNKAWH